MIKIYGMTSCPDCDYIKPQLDERFEYIDISTNVKLLKEFISLRDNRDEFKDLKENGKLGIPCFIKEDGSISFKPSEFGLEEKPEDGNFCSLDKKGNC